MYCLCELIYFTSQQVGTLECYVLGYNMLQDVYIQLYVHHLKVLQCTQP
jgi:hypothetical protein